ncbi:MAG: hypothetical protein IKO43_03470 [Kiritimatiellae bacterium]|nr:hypothetical protein [Kiritimatiellia bacterium]
MTALEYILDGLEAALALERELGVRSFELEEGLARVPEAERASGTFEPEAAPVVAASVSASASEGNARAARSTAAAPVSASADGSARAAHSTAAAQMVFLHDRALDGAGAEMIAKITAALGFTPKEAPVVWDGALPDAKIYVVLGARALRQWLPTQHGSPGMWVEAGNKRPALVTYSPNYFLRFKEVTPAVKKIKAEMWQSLKAAAARLKTIEP